MVSRLFRLVELVVAIRAGVKAGIFDRSGLFPLDGIGPLNLDVLHWFGDQHDHDDHPRREQPKEDDDQPGQRVRKSLEKFAHRALFLLVTFTKKPNLYLLMHSFRWSRRRARRNADEDIRNAMPCQQEQARPLLPASK